jgi:hypothetical protein
MKQGTFQAKEEILSRFVIFSLFLPGLSKFERSDIDGAIFNINSCINILFSRYEAAEESVRLSTNIFFSFTVE